MPAFRLIISSIMLWLLLASLAGAQPVVADSASTLSGSGGETSPIVYHRYRDLTDLSAAASVAVWRFTIRDGGSFFGDGDRFSTVVDSLRIAVELVGAPSGARTTRSIAWAGIYSIESTPRLLATARISGDSLLFEAIAGRGVEAPDNGAASFELRLKLTDTATIGDRLRFSIAQRDAIARRTASSRFARFGIATSGTGGDRNMIVTTGLHLVISSSFPDALLPGVRFAGALSLLDSVENVMVGLSDTLRAYSRTGFGAISGRLTAVDSAGIFSFDSLYYPYRNDSAVIGFVYPGADTLEVALLFSGGAATVPTVAHIRPSGPARRTIDGTGISIESGTLDGVFLFERIERTPVTVGTLPGGVSLLLARHFRISMLPGSTTGGTFRLGLPIDGLSSGAHPASIRLLHRIDSLSAWIEPTTEVEGFDAAAVYGSFDTIGEFGFGTNVDIAVPVIGLTLSAELTPEGGPRLRWRTKSEIGNAGFILRRALQENGPFVTVDSYRANEALKGAGSSAIGAAYQWEDHDPRTSRWSEVWYLLVEVSFDGLESVHGPVRLAQAGANRAGSDRSTGVAVHPNPFSERTTVAFDTREAGPVVLILFDSRGAIVLSRRYNAETNGRTEIQLSADDLPAGTYRYRLEFDGGESTGGIVRATR